MRRSPMRDTPPEIEAKMQEMFEAKTPDERLAMSYSMHATSKWFIIRAIQEENPHISEGALRREVFLRFYGNDYTPEEREKIAQHLERSATQSLS